MKTYKIPLHKTDSKEVRVNAESPHEALKKAREQNPGWRGEMVTELIPFTGSCFDSDPDYTEGETSVATYSCETCGKPIFEGESFYQWQDVETCIECGGAGPDHKPVTAVA